MLAKRSSGAADVRKGYGSVDECCSRYGLNMGKTGRQRKTDEYFGIGGRKRSAGVPQNTIGNISFEALATSINWILCDG